MMNIWGNKKPAEPSPTKEKNRTSLLTIVKQKANSTESRTIKADLLIDTPENKINMTVNQGEGKCTVYITCENAKKLKKKLQEIITNSTGTLTKLGESLESISNLSKIPEIDDNKLKKLLEHYSTIESSIMQRFKNLEKEAGSLKTKLDTIKTKLRAEKINIKDEQIKVEVKFGDSVDLNKDANAIITDIYPKKTNFDIEYTKNGKQYTLPGIGFSKLCIIEFDAEHPTAIKADLKCNSLDGGAKKHKKSSKKSPKKASKKSSKKQHKMKGGGLSERSISTDSLC